MTRPTGRFGSGGRREIGCRFHMSVETRKTRYGPVYAIRYRDPTGRQVRETLGTEAEGWTKAKAKKAETQRIVEARVRPIETWTFKRVAERWFEETSRRKDWKPRTLMAYKRSIFRLEMFHKMHVQDISPKDVVRFIEKSTYAAKTTNDDISVLHGILDYAVRLELIKVNPAHRPPRPKNSRKKWRILTPEEIRRVDAEFTDRQAQLMFRVLTRTGIRRHELRNLRVRDIDFSRNTIRITDSKTEEGERSIAIPASLSTQLKEWKARGDDLRGFQDANSAGPLTTRKDVSTSPFVFQSSTGNRVGAQWYTEQFFDATFEAGITQSNRPKPSDPDYVRPFHDMRHTAITNMAATGKTNIVALMGIAGHRDPKVTRQYMHLAGVVFHDEAEALEARFNGS